MTREIKFRAWDKKNKILYQKIWNLQWCFGGIRFAWDDYQNSDGETMITDLVDGDFELMQYTGLKDKNGKEIWEGDVVRSKKGKRSTITFDYGSFGAEKIDKVGTSHGDWYGCATITFQDQEYEVIGNIYENPELLEGGSL